MREMNHLLRVLGIAFGLAAVVGSVVGQGILRSPSIVAEASGSPAVLIGLWALGAVVALVSATAFAELGAAIPRAGGPMAFIQRAYGPRSAIVAAPALLVAYVLAQAVVVYVLGEFLARLGVGEGRIGPGGLGIATLAVFFLVNATGTRASGAMQVILSSLKGLVLLALVVLLFAQPGVSPAPVSAPTPHTALAGFGTAMLVIVGTYNGWCDVVCYGEEIEDPGRALPRALFGGIIGVAALYLMVNLALLHVMTPAMLAKSDFAAADAARAVFGSRGDTVFTLIGVLSVGAIANLGLMTTSRLALASARAGMLPRRLASVSRLGTPLAAVLAISLATAAFLYSGTYLTLSETGISLIQAIYVAVILAVIVLRRKEPELARPYRVPFYPWPIVAALAINLALLAVFIVQDPMNALLGFGLVALLSAGYLLFGKRGAAAHDETAGAETWPLAS
jgi:APA family basic amino acid/polyamine antiporter